MVADELDYVVGVDTHRDEHVLAVVVAGAVVAQQKVSASGHGYAHSERARRGGARGWALVTERAAVARQGRRARPRPCRTGPVSELALPRSGQQREALRLLLVDRRSGI